jgi:hypothetical protein
VERGAILARAVRDPANADHDTMIERLIEIASSPRLEDVGIVDAAGHARGVYRPLLVHGFLTAFNIRYETLAREEFGRWEEALRRWCEVMEGVVGENPRQSREVLSRAVARRAWSALVLHVAGKVFIRDAWTDLASATMGQIVRTQQESGAFLAPAPAENPELVWYEELCILHAVAGYAVRAEDRNIARAVARAGEFHLRETQPDHATAQPWGLFAFIWNPQTRPLADQLLHAVTLNRGTQLDGVSLILLSDTLYSLRLFL